MVLFAILTVVCSSCGPQEVLLCCGEDVVPAAPMYAVGI